MFFKSEVLNLSSSKPIELIEITDAVQKIVTGQSFRQGLVVVSSKHTTAGVCINEKCERLAIDAEIFFKKIASPTADYRHDHSALDGRKNAHSHLLGYFVGNSETLIVRDGKLELGSWQSLFFVELDGPRPRREVMVTMMGM